MEVDEGRSMPARAGGPGASRHPRLGAWAASIAVLGLLLFVWPFVRTPLLGIGLSYAHLLGAWGAVVLALALLSRAIGRDRRGGGDDA
jgi:hypothetical protein